MIDSTAHCRVYTWRMSRGAHIEGLTIMHACAHRTKLSEAPKNVLGFFFSLCIHFPDLFTLHHILESCFFLFPNKISFWFFILFIIARRLGGFHFVTKMWLQLYLPLSSCNYIFLSLGCISSCWSAGSCSHCLIIGRTAGLFSECLYCDSSAEFTSYRS